MRRYISVLATLLVLSCLIGCHKEKESPALPPITSEGKCTFGCKINGEVFLADGSGTDSPNKGIYGIIDANFDTLGNFLPLDSCNLWIVAESGSRAISLYVNPYLSVGRHVLMFNTYTYPTLVLPKNYGFVTQSGRSYITTSSDTGSVTITKWDQKKFIISGTFQFRAKNLTNKTDVVAVTDGRFDLDYSKTH